MKFIRWFVNRYLHYHWHIIRITDIAVGPRTDGATPLTAFKNVCVLCGREYIDVSDSAIELWRKGYTTEEVLHWMDGEIPGGDVIL